MFRPSNLVRSDGLYPYRYFVYIGALLVPATMAGLAFINPRWGYVSQGAFCSLPRRPFWYRLALAWIPRYAIAIIILGLAGAIYAHVGFEFRSFTETTRPSFATATPILSAGEMEEGATPDMSEPPNNPHRRGSSVVSFTGTPRRASIVVSLGETTSPRSECPAPRRSHSVPNISGGIDGNRILPPFPLQACGTAAHGNPALLENSCNNSGNTSPMSNCPTAHVNRQIERQRAHIHRQLRLLFIYPIVYILMWIVPFVSHCMMYYDKWAAHPVYGLSLASTICIALMGAVDCLIFSLRERPWRYIPSSDGTFLGSLVYWRTYSQSSLNGAPTGGHARPSGTLQRPISNANPETPSGGVMSQPSFTRSVARVGRTMRTGGSSDHAKEAAEMARTRLEMEKQDRRRAASTTRDGGERAGRSNTRLDVIESPGDEIEGFEVGEEASARQNSAEAAESEKEREDSDAAPEGISISDYGDDSRRQSRTGRTRAAEGDKTSGSTWE